MASNTRINSYVQHDDLLPNKIIFYGKIPIL